VDFLARNVAQLGLHVFRRVSDTDRVRLTDHPLARLIARPNSWTTRYRLIEALMGDLGIYFNAYWMKIEKPQGGMALLRVPPH
jgi:phage portal protein BeeE